jgi:hypothetical protein
VHKHFRKDRYTREEHIQADIIDCLDQILYFTTTGALAQINDRKGRSKIMKDRPQPRKRPGVEEKKEKKTFATTNRAKAMFGQWAKRTIIDHIDGCRPVDGQCACPRRLVDKD